MTAAQRLFGCTVGGTAGAATSIFGSAKALRSPDTDVVSRDSTAPPNPVSAPAPRNPSVTSDSRLPRSGASAAGSPSGSSVNRPEVSSRSTATPQAVPTTVGTMSTTDAPARDRTAAQPAIPASTIAALPTGTRRVSYCPVTAATAAITATTRIDNTSLSAVAKVWIAHSLTGPGVRSMTADPTALRASDSGPRTPPATGSRRVRLRPPRCLPSLWRRARS